MGNLDNRIKVYLENNSILSLATCNGNQPYSAICFYTYAQELNALIFSSDEKTRHIQEGMRNNSVAGTITNCYNGIHKMQGIQFTGKVSKASPVQDSKVNKLYYKAFPFAKIMTSELWLIELEFLKMTDNTLVFGKKIIWHKEEQL